MIQKGVCFGLGYRSSCFKRGKYGAFLTVQLFKTLPPDAGGVGLIPGQGAKIPHTSLPKNQNRSNIMANAIKTLNGPHFKKYL